MTKPLIRIHNIETGEIIDREMTQSEFQAYEADQAKIAEDSAAKAVKESAKAELLARLGITAEEAKLLLG